MALLDICWELGDDDKQILGEEVSELLAKRGSNYNFRLTSRQIETMAEKISVKPLSLAVEIVECKSGIIPIDFNFGCIEYHACIKGDAEIQEKDIIIHDYTVTKFVPKPGIDAYIVHLLEIYQDDEDCVDSLDFEFGLVWKQMFEYINGKLWQTKDYNITINDDVIHKTRRNNSADRK